ncbi:MAG: ATP-binding protein [Acidobacteria bacterium]|nr:MAG: ATP-binding protein [Acidobacteriota bacterium]
MKIYQESREHLFDELRRLDLLLNLHAARQRIDPGRADFNQFRGLFISEEEIDLLLGAKRSGKVALPKDAAESRATERRMRRLQLRIRARVAASLRAGVRLSLPRLARLFRLSPFDVDALLICLAPELDRRYGKLYAYLQDDVTQKAPSVDLILNLLCDSADEKVEGRRRLTNDSPLRRYSLLEFRREGDQSSSGLTRPLKIDDRILHFLLDVDSLDPQTTVFSSVAKPRFGIDELLLPAEIGQGFVSLFQNRVAAHSLEEGVACFVLQGPEGAGKRSLAEALCQAADKPLITADLSQTPVAPSDFSSSLGHLLREASLRGAFLYFNHAESVLGNQEHSASRPVFLKLLEEWDGVAILGSSCEWPATDEPDIRAFFKIAIPPPDYPMRLRLWELFLDRNGCIVEDRLTVEQVADRFQFTPGKIHRAVVEAQRQASLNGRKSTAIQSEDLFQACRCLSSGRLSSLARRVVPVYRLNDIVLPPPGLRLLREICLHVEHRHKVFQTWGFQNRFSLGKGLNILFVGPSGTGKTMAAEIVAGELRLELYKIDLSSVVSKYIGETEKNLDRIFEAAQLSNAILFFDEADALFGKRSDVKDSHDRYANIEISYLLQKMEEQEGIVILSSNLNKNIDEAFTRRMRFVVEFPFPEEEHRYRIWKTIFPKDTPLSADIDLRFLAGKFKIAGGNIRNIALNAAFLAASNSGVVGMEHVMRAAAHEFQKMGRLCVKSDFEHYFDLVREAS